MAAVRILSPEEVGACFLTRDFSAEVSVEVEGMLVDCQ